MTSRCNGFGTENVDPTYAATKAAADFAIPRPLCLGVTVLTSLDRRALQREVGVPTSVESHVLHLAGLAREAGLDGCVASAQEISALRLAMGEMADALLLSSQRVMPEKLMKAGYQFKNPHLRRALHDIVTVG